MTFAAPFFLWAAGAVALATVAAHLFAWRRPPAVPLPTARFAPERPARVVARALRPTDVALLAVRVAALMLVGIALAGPRVTPSRKGTARVVVVDRSRSAGDGLDVADSARAVYRPGDAIVVFDSVARELPADVMVDSIGVGSGQTTAPRARGSMSAGLVTAVRAADRLARAYDSVEIVVVSPVTTDEIDAATNAIRQQFGGAVRVIRPTPASAETLAVSRTEVRAPSTDPVAAALSLVGPVFAGKRVRVIRDEATAADSAFARTGGTLVVWPATPEPSGWSRRAARDTAFAVATANLTGGADGVAAAAAVVARFDRVSSPPGARVVARWADGETAAADVALGDGCVRSVGVLVPAASDLALTPAFRHFVRRMVEPCSGPMLLARTADSVLARVLAVPTRERGTMAVRAAEPTRVAPDWLAAWLLGGALALVVLELFIRKGESYASA